MHHSSFTWKVRPCSVQIKLVDFTRITSITSFSPHDHLCYAWHGCQQIHRKLTAFEPRQWGLKTNVSETNHWKLKTWNGYQLDKLSRDPSWFTRKRVIFLLSAGFHTHTHVYIYIYIWVCVCVFVCVFLYMLEAHLTPVLARNGNILGGCWCKIEVTQALYV